MHIAPLSIEIYILEIHLVMQGGNGVEMTTTDQEILSFRALKSYSHFACLSFNCDQTLSYNITSCVSSALTMDWPHERFYIVGQIADCFR
jgi:hypothetical protein